MSNNLVPQPLSLHSASPPTSQYELPPSNLDSSRPGMQLPLKGVSDGSPLQSSAVYSQPMSPSFPMSWGAKSLRVPVQRPNGRVDLHVASHLPPFSTSPANLVGGMGAMANNLAVLQQFTSPNKRKTPMDYTSSSISPCMSAAPNKRPTQTEHRPWLLQLAALNRTNMAGEALQKMAVSKHIAMQNKKQSPLESLSAKSMQQHRLLSPKTQISPMITSESFEAVRSKMRESLAAALAQVTHEEGRSPNDVKNLERDISTSADQLQVSPSTIPLQSPQGNVGDVLRESKRNFDSGEGNGSQDMSDGKIGPSLGKNIDALVSTTSNTLDFQYGSDLLGEDVSFGDGFFVKDELLQGNGLSWVLESEEEEMIDGSTSQAVEGEISEGVSVGRQGRDLMVLPPEVLASQIEAELYKLFDGVNKKYKEKGRSLLFNLKDRNNPELRQRVVSGEIPPDRLCSMSAEELASKELSEWRMAKAEELAQMVFLPDTDVDVKRLVKKTHKGELQVEVEQDDSLSVEVSARVPIISYGRSRTREQHSGSDKPVEAQDKTQDVDGKRDSVERNSPYMLTIPSDDQVSEVDISEDDAMKDLPPIVSLDEFMQSLDSEPPFEDLHVNAGNTNSISKKTARIGSKTRPSERSPKDSGTKDNSSPLDDARSKSLDVSESEKDDVGKSSKGDHVWEGSLQLSGSSTSVVSVTALFKSGERTITKEWSGCPEVKGRVRLDAFEKFLGGLRLSRSRALMVVHLVCKESSPKRQRDSVGELADSYVADERVGIVEPCRGMEIYLCPPNDKTRQMLSKVLTDDQSKTLDGIDEGLIGVVVWRRIRPNPSATRHSTSSRKQQQQQHSVSSSKRQAADRDVNIRNSPSDNLHRPTVLTSAVRPLLPVEADEDDAPPGFGPGMAAPQEVDDLPEFNFSEEIAHTATTSFSNTSTRMMMESRHGHSKTSRPLDQIRELVQKYGQPEGNEASVRSVGVPIQPWNDDDDDDIPEWQPGSHTVLTRSPIIPSVLPQQQNNLYAYPTTTLLGTAPRTSQAARQPAWQDPRRNRGSGI